MKNFIVELSEKEAKEIYGGTKYVWLYINGAKTLVRINS